MPKKEIAPWKELAIFIRLITFAWRLTPCNDITKTAIKDTRILTSMVDESGINIINQIKVAANLLSASGLLTRYVLAFLLCLLFILLKVKFS